MKLTCRNEYPLTGGIKPTYLLNRLISIPIALCLFGMFGYAERSRRRSFGMRLAVPLWGFRSINHIKG